MTKFYANAFFVDKSWGWMLDTGYWMLNTVKALRYLNI